MTLIPYGRHSRWTGIPWSERSKIGKRLRRQKGNKHALVTLRSMGHFAFMRLCYRYQRKYRRKLTPAERNWIRAVHAEEINASRVGWPWEKKPRAEAPYIPDPPDF